jgi:riboflavin kinase/FMN adenylyltransferase
VTPTEDKQGLVSSSRVRSLLQAGDVAEARQMLTQPYRIRGIIVHGDARGAALGFPTANLDGIDTLVPAFGVYAGRAAIDSRWHWAAIHIGPSPTFGQKLPRVEVHVLNFDGSLYGQTLEVEFHQQLRKIQQFGDRTELIAQLQLDIEATRRIARNEVTGA